MNKYWERFFYIFTWLWQGSSYLSPRAYAILHRMHHAYSDTPMDPHSPHHTENLFTMMWKTKNIYNDYFSFKLKSEERFSQDIPDWNKFDRFADTMFVRLSWGLIYVVIYLLSISVFQLSGTHWWMYFLLPIHFMMGPVHGAIVNWSGHKYGYSNFENNDKSKNSLLLDVFMLGELFQNNHHKLPNRPNFDVKWYEFDPTFPIVKLLHATGIIKLKSV